MDANKLIEIAKRRACDPAVALGYVVTRNHAARLNITVSGPVTVAKHLVIVPIDILNMNTYKSERLRVVFSDVLVPIARLFEDGSRRVEFDKSFTDCFRPVN